MPRVAHATTDTLFHIHALVGNPVRNHQLHAQLHILAGCDHIKFQIVADPIVSVHYNELTRGSPQ